MSTGTRKPLPDLLRRQRALDKVVAKYRNRRLDFRTADCIRMARTHLVALGHRPPVLPRYSNGKGALRALRQAGFDSIEQLLDSLLPKIPAARALPGDFILLEGEPDDHLDAVTISMGRKVMGWHGETETCVMMTPLLIKAAYRV